MNGPALNDLAGLLFDYAVEHPEHKNRDAIAALGWDLATFNKVARRLRLILGDDDSINYVCDPGKAREPWTYRLVGDFSNARGWTANRLRDSEARLETVQSVTSSIARGTDGRTREGRRARLITSVIGGLRSQLAAMDEDDHDDAEPEQ